MKVGDRVMLKDNFWGIGLPSGVSLMGEAGVVKFVSYRYAELYLIDVDLDILPGRMITAYAYQVHVLKEEPKPC